MAASRAQRWVWWAVAASFAFLALVILVVSIAPEPDKKSDQPVASANVETPTPSAKIQTIDDVIKKAQVAFAGGHRPEAIRGKLQATMALYGLEETPENYMHAADVLVTLRKTTGETEMTILDYMIKSYVPGVNIKFDEMAALSARFLQFGDRAR